MEKSNLPLPLKKKTIREAISSVRDGSKLEKRTTTQLKHGLVRDGSGRVLKERPQFGGSYLKKRFGYNSKKTSVPFSLKGSKAVVTSLCEAGDFADACFPAFSENTDFTQESARAKRGALSMKSKLLQLQERNRLILAKHQFPRTSLANAHVNLDSTSALLMTPLALKIETTEEEVKSCNEQTRLGESCSTSPIYHELDPIEGHSSPEQHTYQSISEVREEMARLQAQMNFGNMMYACDEHNPANSCLELSELSTRESQKTLYEPGTAQESEPKQNRIKRSIFSKFWLSRRNLFSNQEDATGEGKAVLTSITSLPEDEISAPQAGDGLRNHPSGIGSCSPAQPSSHHLANSRKHSQNMTALSSWNAYSNHSLITEDLHNSDSCQGFYIPTDSSCYGNAHGTCSNRDGVGNSYDCYYGWKSDDEVESDGKMGPVFQKTLQSFAKRPTTKAGMKSKTTAAEEYFSSAEMANALTEYHWNVYQTGNINKKETVATLSSSRRADDFLEAPSRNTRVFIDFHQDHMVTSNFLPVQLTPDQSKASAVLNVGLDTSDIYTHNVDTAFLHSRPATSSSFFGGKMFHSQFSSPSCGVRMAELRAVRRKSESALLLEPSAKTVPGSSIPRHSKSTGSCSEDEETHHQTVEYSPCAQSEPTQVRRNMHTILEEDQLMENTASCHLAFPTHSPETECSTGLSKHFESSQRESTLNTTAAGLDSSNTNAECKIPEEMLSSDGSVNDYEKKSGDSTNGASQTKQSTDRKTNGSRLKKPKPVKHSNASSHTKPTNNTGDCSLMINLPPEQNTSLSKARKTENASPNTPPFFNSYCSRTTEREPKPLIRQAVIRQIESVSSAEDAGLEPLQSPHPQRTLQPTPRLKPGSCIPRTKHLSTNRTYSADDKPTRNIWLRENEASKKRVDCPSQKKHLNQRSLEEGTGLLTFSRSYSTDVTFKHKEGEHFSCLYSHNSTSSTETSNRCESTRNWEDQGQTPEVMVYCPHNLECRDHKLNTQMSSPNEYHVSEISSLSSSLTSSNSSSSVFGVTDGESDSPTSLSTRDLQLELESPSSSSSSRRTSEVQSSSSATIPAQDSVSKDAESTAMKPQKGKSQLLAPRTDATRCLERLERLRIETKQTKNESHQKLRH